jgi:hypothetical protein
MNIQPTVSQAIDQLELTPQVLHSLVRTLSEPQASAKPNATSWSVTEIIAHLLHTERNCYQPRVEHILCARTVIVPAYDATRFEAEGAYSGATLTAALSMLGDLRAECVRQLQGLTENDLARSATHESVGRFTLTDLIYEWAAHDVGHIRQVALVIRDVLYNPFIGPFRD